MVTNEERLTELEQRIVDLEAELRARSRPRIPMVGLLRELVPSDVRMHMRAAQRERLLAARAYLDRAITRLNAERTEEPLDGETL